MYVAERDDRLKSATSPSTDGLPTEPLAALTALTAAQEQLVRDLAAATTAQEAVLEDLRGRLGLDRRVGADPFTTTRHRDEVNKSVEIRADLEARLFGAFEVRYQGHALAPWPSQRAASLLKFLLLHIERPVRREVLMDAFWPGSSAKSARNNLNVTVYQLRGQFRAHDPDRTLIVYDAGSYRIDPAAHLPDRRRRLLLGGCARTPGGRSRRRIGSGGVLPRSEIAVRGATSGGRHQW